MTGIQAADCAWAAAANMCIDFLCETSNLRVSRNLIHAFVEFKSICKQVQDYVESEDWLSFLVWCGTMMAKMSLACICAGFIYSRFFS
jgi:hypothetical protein